VIHVLFLLEVIVKLFLEVIFSSVLLTRSDYLLCSFFTGSDFKTFSGRDFFLFFVQQQ